MNNFYIRIKSIDQLAAVSECADVFGLMLDSRLVKCQSNGLALLNGDGLTGGLNPHELYIDLPEVARESKLAGIEELIACCGEDIGFVVHNPDELGILQSAGFGGGLIADSFLYAYNSEAVQFYLDIFPQMRFLASDELTVTEQGEVIDTLCTRDMHSPEGIKLASDSQAAVVRAENADLQKKRFIMGRSGWQERFIRKIYGHQRLMTTDQCICKNYTGCREKTARIKDESENIFYAAGECEQCYSVIYNGKPTFLADKAEEIPENDVLLDFTIEGREQTKQILKRVFDAWYGTGAGSRSLPIDGNGMTRGHFYKGID